MAKLLYRTFCCHLITVNGQSGYFNDWSTNSCASKNIAKIFRKEMDWCSVDKIQLTSGMHDSIWNKFQCMKYVVIQTKHILWNFFIVVTKILAFGKYLTFVIHIRNCNLCTFLLNEGSVLFVYLRYKIQSVFNKVKMQ